MTDTATDRHPWRRRLGPTLGLALVLCVVGLLRVRLLGMPLERDEGVYAYIGWRLHHGEVPYRDVFTDKPPLGHLLYSGIVAAAGHRAMGIRVAALAWLLITTGVAYAVCRSCFNPYLSVLGAGVWGLSASLPTVSGPTFNLEMILMLPMWASVWAALRAVRRGSWRPWALAGVLAGTAFMTTQQAAPHAAFLGLWWVAAWWAHRHDWSWHRLVAGLGALAGGFLLVVGLVCAGIWAVGAWTEFVDGCWLYNIRTYAQRIPLASAWTIACARTRDLFVGHFVLFALAGFSFVSGLWRPGPARWCLGWLVCQTVAAAIDGHFYPHYFQLLLPPLCLGAVDGVDFLLQTHTVRPDQRPVVKATGFSAIALLVLVPLVSYAHYLFVQTPRQISRTMYGINPFPESQRVADYLQSRTDTSDEIFIYGSEPQILFLAARRSASRYVFVYPLTSRGQEHRQRRVIDEIRRRAPAYIVWVRVAGSQLWSPHADPLLEREMQRLGQGPYQLDGAVVIEPDTSLFYLGPDDLQSLPPHALKQAAVVLLVRRDRVPARRQHVRCPPPVAPLVPARARRPATDNSRPVCSAREWVGRRPR